MARRCLYSLAEKFGREVQKEAPVSVNRPVPDTYLWHKDRLNSFDKTIDISLTVDRSPPTHMKKPACCRNEQIVSPEQFAALLPATRIKTSKTFWRSPGQQVVGPRNRCESKLAHPRSSVPTFLLCVSVPLR